MTVHAEIHLAFSLNKKQSEQKKIQGHLLTSNWITEVPIAATLRSSKDFDTCKTGGPKWPYILWLLHWLSYRIKGRLYLHPTESLKGLLCYTSFLKRFWQVKQVVWSGQAAFCNWGQLQNAGPLQTTCFTCRIIHWSHQLTKFPFPCFLARWELFCM